MNKCKVFAATLGAMTVLAGSAVQAFAAEPTSSNPAASPAAYTEYLRHSAAPEAAQTLKAFQTLTPNEQSRFTRYLDDTTLIESFMTESTGAEEGLTSSSGNTSHSTSLRDGEVTFESERTITGAVASSKPLPKGNHQAKYTNNLKIHGITVMKLNLSVNFESTGKDIGKVNYAEPSMKNVSGVIHITHGVPRSWRGQWGFCRKGQPCSHGHLAGASVIWEGTVSKGTVEAQVDKEQYMTANVYGTVTDAGLKTV